MLLVYKNIMSCVADVFSKSQAMLVDELSRCSTLGLSLFNFHPGAAMDSTPEKCMEKIAQAINHAHQQTPAVITGSLETILMFNAV